MPNKKRKPNLNYAHSAIFKQYDTQLLAVIFCMLLVGLVMVASSSITILGKDAMLYYFWRQSLSVLIGITAGFIILHIPMRFWEDFSLPLLVFGILLLILVLVPGVGREVNGSTRWINTALFPLQPSELVKFCIIAYLARYLVHYGDMVRAHFFGLTKLVFILVLIVFLLLLEPDFGASAVLLATVLGMLFMSGIPLHRFILWVTVTGFLLALMALLSPYRLQRIMSFVDPWQDPYGSGFQLTQALIAFGRGELFGVGLGNSVQKMFYLPDAHTDFLFAVVAEETGLVGSVAVIFLFAFLVWRCFAIGAAAARNNKCFSAFFAYGIGLLTGLQAFMNIGVNMGVLPTKGMTLPLMSYGGNSLVIHCALLAILVRIEYENRQCVSRQDLHEVGCYAGK